MCGTLPGEIESQAISREFLARNKFHHTSSAAARAAMRRDALAAKQEMFWVKLSFIRAERAQ
jgi:hypothetical protein